MDQWLAELYLFGAISDQDLDILVACHFSNFNEEKVANLKKEIRALLTRAKAAPASPDPDVPVGDIDSDGYLFYGDYDSSDADHDDYSDPD